VEQVDLPPAWADTHASDLVEQNRAQTSVRLSPKGHELANTKEDDPPPEPAEQGPFWVYYNHINRPNGPRRIILHRADCTHCRQGRGGHGGNAPKVIPAESSLYVPRAAWIGPFSRAFDAAEWCRNHRELQEPPEHCSDCFPAQP
jgi:hypothetical protein